LSLLRLLFKRSSPYVTKYLPTRAIASRFLKIVGYPAAIGAGLAGFGYLSGMGIREVRESLGKPSPREQLKLNQEYQKLQKEQLDTLRKMQDPSYVIIFQPKSGWTPSWQTPQQPKRGGFDVNTILLIAALLVVVFVVMRK
jgi:hypothetical protein